MCCCLWVDRHLYIHNSPGMELLGGLLFALTSRHSRLLMQVQRLQESLISRPFAWAVSLTSLSRSSAARATSPSFPVHCNEQRLVSSLLEMEDV